MKKLFFLINTLEIGGAEKILTEMVNNLDKSKYDITLCTLYDIEDYKKRLNPDVHYKNLIKIKNTFIRRALVYLISYVLPESLVHRLLIGNKYDVEIAFLEGIPTKIISGSGNKDSRKYAWVHIDLYNTFGDGRLHKNIEKQKKRYKKFDRIVCVSESVKSGFIKRFEIDEKLIVKYNILNDEDIIKKAEEGHIKKDKFRIVTVGRVTEQKGFDRLLKVFKNLIGDGFDGELLIVGDGIQRAELEEYALNNNISSNVFFLGMCDNPYKYMKSADLIVFPSRAEGYSTVVCEAVILGMPVVATDCAGMREILGDSEYGLVVENTDNAILSGVKKMIYDRELRESYSNAAKMRKKDFSMQRRIKELEELFY